MSGLEGFSNGAERNRRKQQDLRTKSVLLLLLLSLLFFACDCERGRPKPRHRALFSNRPHTHFCLGQASSNHHHRNGRSDLEQYSRRIEDAQEFPSEGCSLIASLFRTYTWELFTTLPYLEGRGLGLPISLPHRPLPLCRLLMHSPLSPSPFIHTPHTAAAALHDDDTQ